ncbi:TetR family transcriptional regulator [Nocardioides zeae]|uniref:TetR/AcrR family transcriptional regulator n=1 Tax=Nocardioides zeae TaxID=1457234 RepID=A0A6P0HGM3_9ACTN|nr:TetR/AcrR family transcriptional regulator [Nocardioides zeae]
MARPSKPLISREATVRTALAIIDADGLDALSVPRLARELNVKAPSLYHHFADKRAILQEVAAEIVAPIEVPDPPPDHDWIGWFTQLALNLRAVVMPHRRAAPLLIEHLPRDLLTDYFELTCAYLAECGVPAHLHVPFLDGMEKLALGATIAEAMRPEVGADGSVFAHLDPDQHPHLADAVAANEHEARGIFEQTIRSFLAGMERLVAEA